MFLIDDILFSPVKGLLWVFKEIHDIVDQEKVDERENITRSLSELYLKLEAQSISEAEFDAQEKVLLDRLDALDLSEEDDESDEGDESDESDEGDEGGEGDRSGHIENDGGADGDAIVPADDDR